MRTLVISLAIGLLVATTATAGDCSPDAACCEDPGCCEKAGQDKSCCPRCGSKAKTCKVESGVKLVKRHVWVVECSEMCPSLPGRDCCRNRCKTGDCGKCCAASCEDGCAGGKDPCESLKDRKYIEPRCMKSRCIKKLVKKTILCEVPAYKCVPACGKCGANCGEPAAACGGCGEAGDAEEATPGEGAPREAPPAPDAPAPDAPAPDAPAPETAPEPPVVGTAYLEALKLDR